MNEIKAFTDNVLKSTFCPHTYTFPQNYAEMPDNSIQMQSEKLN